MTEKGDRIAKVIARAGVCSRRDAERLIEQGRVKVDGKTITSPALNVLPTQQINVDGEDLPTSERTRLWRYFKPNDLVCTHSDEKGRETVFDNLPDNLPRVISVGRLDLTTEGLLLLTNDGELARYLELPSTGLVRRYRVRAMGQLDKAKLEALKNGIEVDDVRYGPIEVVIEDEQSNAANNWLEVSLTEGKNREIRKVLNHLDLQVSRLIRLSYGPFKLGDLKPEEVQEVSEKALKTQLPGFYS